MQSQRVSTLLGWLCELGDGDIDELDRPEIRDGIDLLIGRDSNNCHIIRKAPSISNIHIRIYSIFGELNAFVYAEDLSTNGSYWLYKKNSLWHQSRIGKGNAVLLSDGDQVQLCDGSCYVFYALINSTPPPIKQDASCTQEKEIESFMNMYRITDRQLGAGAYARVHLAIDLFSQRQMACKMVALKDSSGIWVDQKKSANGLWREVKLLKEISHPNIIHVERVFYTESNIYIMEDLITGGDLMSFIERRGAETIQDADACFIIYQILKALEHLHGRGIVHRDIKPDNILMTRKDAAARIIVTDFGQSIDLGSSRNASSKRMKTFCGTLDFVAPEVHAVNPLVSKSGYTMAADMWSVGALTTALFWGRSLFVDLEDSAFQRQESAAILNAIAKCNLNDLDEHPLWQEVNQDARDFIKEVLVLNEVTRLKVGQALQHDWLTRGGRQEYLDVNYQKAIKGWLPSAPALDFEEDLGVFIAARRSRTDSKLMPPPPKPRAEGKAKLPDHERYSSTLTHASPYFSAQVGHGVAVHTGGSTSSQDLTPFSGKRNRVPSRTGKEQVKVQKDVAHPRQGSSSVPTAKRLRTVAEQFSNEIQVANTSLAESQNSIGKRTIHRPRSGSLEDEKLHDEISKESRQFISARAFGQSIKSRRDLKACFL